jgi:hypothetical protein
MSKYTQQHKNWEECGPCSVFAGFTLAFALQLRKKHGKTSVRVVRHKYTMNLPEGLGLTAADIEVFEGTDWKKQRPATGQGIRNILACLLDMGGFWRMKLFVWPNLSS